MATKYDHIIVGAGIEGSWTAYHLVKLGYKVLLLEQFTLPHSRGSSHGQSRITRYGYVEDFYAALMREAYSKWSELEREAAVTLFVETGALYFAGPSEYKDLDKLISNLNQVPEAKYKRLSAEDLKKSFPQARFSPDHIACFEETAGVLLASKCLDAVQRKFKELGGVLIDGFEVQRIYPGQEAVVHGERTWKGFNNGNHSECEQSFTGNSVIICAGPWSGPFIKRTLGLNLPLSSHKINVLYWPLKDNKKEGLPVAFIDLINDGEYYGVPSVEYPNMVKICCHHQEEADPNVRDGANRKMNNKKIKKYVSNHFPTLDANPAIAETCMYTVTPDEVCILDKHPLYHNIIIGCGFSGTGFKISPVVGHILGNMAEGKEPCHNIKPFALSRFNKMATIAKL